MHIFEPSCPILSEQVEPAPHGTLTVIWPHDWHHAVTDKTGVIQIATKAGELQDRSRPSNAHSFNIQLRDGYLTQDGKVVLPKQQEPWSFEFHPLGLLIGFSNRICLLRL